MEKIENLPNTESTIGAREIMKKIEKDEINFVVVAKNCPENLIEKIKIETNMFDGNQKELGTKLGKPFPVAMVGYKK